MSSWPIEVCVESPHLEMRCFTLRTEDEKVATMYANGDLEMRIYRDGELTVETSFLSRVRFFDLPTRPRDFEVLLHGEERGHIHRSWGFPWDADTLTLDGREHPLPGFGHGHVRSLDLRLHCDFVSGRPQMTIENPRRLDVGLLALGWVWVKDLYV